MKTLLLTLLLFLSQFLMAQNKPYFQYTDTGHYTPIINGTVITPTLAWGQEISVIVPIGFSFRTMTGLMDSVIITERNLQKKYSPSDRKVFTISAAELRNFKYKDRATLGESESIISYRTTGEPGKRIFKVQYENMGLTSYDDDFVNYQVWLYEDRGNIEFRFGPQNLEAPNEISFGGGAISGLVYRRDSIQPLWAVLRKGYPVNPQAYQDKNGNFEENNIWHPPGDSVRYVMEGILLATTLPSIQFSEVLTFNNSGNVISLDAKLGFSNQIEKVVVYDVKGLMLTSKTWDNTSMVLDLNPYSAGMVFIAVYGEFGQVVEKTFVY